jgi:ATP-binding cassette subfamily F protein 3
VIQLHDIRYSIGDRVLFDDVSWVLSPGDRYALVGPNGAGKTTLIRIALGEYTAETGRRVVSRGTRLGYLPQEAAERFDGTVLERAMEAHRHVLEMREELDALHASLQGISADDPHLESLLERAGELQHRLDMHDEHAIEPEARRVLSGLGFSRRDQDRALSEFSGGWRMRAALAALLLTDPTLLFLDEPTNHLDLPAMEWLEDYLDTFAGGLVVVSHDRVFLDRVATGVWELDHSEISEYPMRFTEYLEERERRRDQMAAQNEQLDKRIAQLSRFVERFGAKNTKATQAQSKRKMIDRLKAERVVIPRAAKRIRFQFPDPPHAGRVLLRLRDASFGYSDEQLVFEDARIEIEKGTKIAIVGANGAGKTTLLRVIAGQLPPRAGERQDYAHTKMAFFAQHAAETLEGSDTVLGSLEDVAPAEWRPRLRGLLGNFLLQGDDVFKHVRVLSGGERQRVALARILMAPANLLLLDEPTHHLDLAGKEVLEDALEQYPGSVLIVTHDRSLMARVATQVLEVHDGRVILHPGGYDDYEHTRLQRLDGAAAPAGPPRMAGHTDPTGRASAKPAPATAPRPSPAATAQAESKRERAERQKREKDQLRIERDIEAREGRVRELETQLADPGVYQDAARSKELVAEYERVRTEVESLWQRLAELSG